jgi:hypothetical protein
MDSLKNKKPTGIKSPYYKEEFSTEQRILNHLMLQSMFIKDMGLFQGKMGIAIMFAHYHQKLENVVYEEIADELMEQIMNHTTKELLIGLGTGFAGIGWGVEYLIQNGFTEGDGMEICEEIDKKIMGKDPRRIVDFSLEYGLEGLLHYVLAHIQGTVKQNTRMPFDEMYLKDLYSAVKSVRQHEISDELLILTEEYINFMKNKKINHKMQLEPFVEIIEIDHKKILEYPLGLRKGLSGTMLNTFLK